MGAVINLCFNGPSYLHDQVNDTLQPVALSLSVSRAVKS